MVVTTEDIQKHEADLFELITNDEDCRDFNFYAGMLERFVRTFDTCPED